MVNGVNCVTEKLAKRSIETTDCFKLILKKHVPNNWYYG